MNTLFAASALLGLLWAAPGHAVVIGAHNTGVDANDQLLVYTAGPGTLDPHYSLSGPSSTPAVLVNPLTYPAAGPWLPDAASLVSQWIGPTADFNHLGTYPFTGFFDYTLSITAAAGDTLSGRWASDNTASLLLGGNPTGNQISANNASDFSAWHPFTVNGLAGGSNALTFHVLNTGENPTGLRVEFVTGVPEPASALLLGLGLAVLLRRSCRTAHG